MATNPYDSQTDAGRFSSNGWSALTELGKKYKDNPELQQLIAGAQIDGAQTSINMGNNLAYQTSLASLLDELGAARDELKTANTIEIIGAEGREMANLIGRQGTEQIRVNDALGVQQRLNITKQGEVDTGLLQTKGEQDRLNLGKQGMEMRLNIAKQGEEDRLTDTNRIQTQGSQDRLTDTNRITTQGSEDRKTMSHETDQTIRLRQDARGQTARFGQKFFG